MNRNNHDIGMEKCAPKEFSNGIQQKSGLTFSLGTEQNISKHEEQDVVQIMLKDRTKDEQIRIMRGRI